MSDSADKAIQDFKKRYNDVVKQVIVELNTEIVDNAPYDTGLLKNNQNVSFNRSDTDVKNNPNTQGTDSKRRAASIVKRFKIGMKVFFTSAVNYSYWAHYGNSRGAPATNYILRAAGNIDNIIKRAIRKTT